MDNRPMAESCWMSDGCSGNSVPGMAGSEFGDVLVAAAQYGRLQHSAVALRAMADEADTASGYLAGPVGGMEGERWILRDLAAVNPPSAGAGNRSLNGAVPHQDSRRSSDAPRNECGCHAVRLLMALLGQ